MLVKGNTTLENLAKKKGVSVKLYKFLKSYSVETFDEAILLKDCVVFSEPLLKELNKISSDIERNVYILKEGIIAHIFDKGIISKRLYNCFQVLGFTTIHQLLAYINTHGGKSEILLKQKNFGKMCLDEVDDIIAFLKFYNCNINEFDNGFESGQSEKKNEYIITISTEINKLLELELISLRLFNCLYYTMGFHTIGDIIKYIDETGSINDFLYIRNFGKKCLFELQKLLSKIKDEFSPSSSINSRVSKSRMDTFSINYNELIKNDIYFSHIKQYYETNKSKLSTSTINIIDKNFESMLDVVKLYFVGLDTSSSLSHRNKTNEELNLFIHNLYNYISSFFCKNNEEIELLMLKFTYPFLSESELKFVLDFRNRMLYHPMFFILFHYLTKSNSRFENVLCRFYGIGRRSESLKDISISLNISTERCRQFLREKELSENSFIVSPDIWKEYGFLNDILLYNIFDYKKIAETEGLDQLSMTAFVGLCSLIRNIKAFSIFNKTYYLSNDLYKSFDIKNSIKDIKATLTKKCTEDVSLPISIFIDSYWLNEPTFEKSKVEDIIKYILKENYGVKIGEDNTLYIQRNTLDRSGEIYKIIEEYGKPMHIKLIRETLISCYPELSDITIEQVRTDALKHPHIKPLGKLSTYAIDKWNLYTGTIRDLLYEILSNEKEPMHINDLYDKVTFIYPNTNIKSITTSMFSDELQRFVRFVGSFYGIANKIYDQKFIVWDADAYSRKTFEERIKELENFLKSHHHLPRYNDDNDDEAALCRWFNRVKVNDATITEEQQKRLSDLLERNSDYLVTATEYSFYRYCEEFKAFVEDNMEFPTLETDSAKYGWFYKHKKNYTDYEDKRKVYFEDLIEFLYTYGFEV